MARTAAAASWSHARARARGRRCAGPRSWFAATLILFGLAISGACRAEPVKGEATLSASDGYARLVFKLAENVASEVTTAGSILVIRFARPVDIEVDTLPETLPDYIGSVRRDPDGTAIRLSLTRRVSINSMTAGERLFVDMLPDPWKGPPPSVPVEVIRELSERARVAERALRMQRAAAEAKKHPPIRVRTSVQPTFVRFAFEMPDGVGVSSSLNEQKLTLVFSSLLTFDLADAREAAASNIASINQKIQGTETTAVEIMMIGDVDVHSFREDRNYIIDVAFQQPEKPPPVASAERPAAPAMPANAAAVSGPSPAASMPAIPSLTSSHEVPTPPQSGQIAPSAETSAKEAEIQTKPEIQAEIEQEIKSEKMPASEAPPTELPATKMSAVAADSPEEPALGAMESPAETGPLTPPTANGTPGVVAAHTSDGLSLTFSFGAPVPAALFRHADTLWLVLDSVKPIDVEPIRSAGRSIITDVSVLPLQEGQAIRIRLNRPQMPSLASNDPQRANWTLTFADAMRTPTKPLVARRDVTDPASANVTVPLSKPGRLHRLVDPDAGETIMVVTAPAPVRGFIKRQDFVEFSLLESIHGVAIRPNSDDVTARINPDQIVVGRPGGLTLSPAEIGEKRASTAIRPIFDVIEWRKNQDAIFTVRQDQLVTAAALAEPDQLTSARVDLARLYLSWGLYAEAKGVLDLVLVDANPGMEDPVALIVHSVASSLMGRPRLAIKDLDNPAIGTNYDSQLWRALAYARLGKWAEAREKFKNAEFGITSLPIDLQRIVIADAMRASLEVKDYSGASKRSSDLEVIGLGPEMKPAVAVLRGQLAEALGHDKDALDEYRKAVESPDRAAAAEAKLLEVALRQRHQEIAQADMLRELETLAVTWRGDGVEVRTMQMLQRIYIDTGRYNEAFAASRTATKLQPNSESARKCQDAASELFAQLFLSRKGDDLPPIDALGMFYEYRELTPIGRRGDEMIRRLADRLVAVDLLDQASELLQYQVDKRLEGAARAQVAARLAMVYLTSRKPDRAISALRSTRISDLSGELRQQRLLLEARAQSDVGRHDLALDLISNIAGREATRLRSDIYWAARRWRDASEQIELYYADRWRDFKPLEAMEKSDVIRAVVGYALAEDVIGLARFREKYAPLMSGDTDRVAFETASKPASATSAGFTDIARLAAKVDTLDGFLREMKARFPDASARVKLPPAIEKPDLPTGSLPAIVGVKSISAAR
jgi:tetratricopeptide (TPR) repeat protein